MTPASLQVAADLDGFFSREDRRIREIATSSPRNLFVKRDSLYSAIVEVQPANEENYTLKAVVFA